MLEHGIIGTQRFELMLREIADLQALGTVPDSASSVLMSVDLPCPFAPSRTMRWPFGIDCVTPSTIGISWPSSAW